MFKPEDYSQLTGWFKHREMNVPPLEMLSNVGYIMDNVAAGFIYTTNSNMAIIDCYITNPMSDEKIRDMALDWITIHLSSYAKNCGFKVIKCDTKLKKVIDRAKNHGFKEIGQFTSLVKDI